MADFDDEELLKELESLNMDHDEEQVEGLSNKNKLPVVPSNSFSKKVEAMNYVNKEDDELTAMDSMVS